MASPGDISLNLAHCLFAKTVAKELLRIRSAVAKSFIIKLTPSAFGRRGASWAYILEVMKDKTRTAAIIFFIMVVWLNGTKIKSWYLKSQNIYQYCVSNK